MNVPAAFATLALLLQSKQDPAGAKLVEQLKDELTRMAAFYELARRSGDEDAKTEAQFRESRRNPELVVCPQGEGRPPIYMLLSDFLPQGRRDKALGGADEKIFKPMPPGSRRKKKAIDAFKADGTRVMPFGTANVLDDGILTDMNGDGLVEMADGISHYAQDFCVLEVSIIREQAQRIFAVVYNGRRDREWGYDFVDEDGDRRLNIRLGPLTEDGELIPTVVYKWDADKKTYVGPQGGPGDHFRVIDASNVRKELKRLEEEKTVFPAVDRAALKKRSPAALPDRPYLYVSLKGKTDDELFAFMDRSYADPRGKERARTVEPKGFRALDPKAAALALAEANRSSKHRANVRLAVDDREGAGPAEHGTLRFTYESSRCYVAHDVHYLLRCTPQESFLIVASTEEGGVVAKELGRQGQSQDLRLCSLDNAEARHYFQVIGWLSRLRSKSEDRESGLSFSTADGQGRLRITSHGGGAPIEVEGSVWSDSIPARWNDDYSKDTYLNFVTFLLQTLSRRHLGSRRMPAFSLQGLPEQPAVPKEVLEEQDRTCKRILELQLAEPQALDPAMLRAACEAAGALALPSAATLLEKLRAGGIGGDAPAEALRKIAAAQDEPALAKMTLDGGQKTHWALLQIKLRFPESYPKALESQLKVVSAREGARVLEELARLDAARAASFAATIPPDDRSPLGRASFSVLRDAGKFDREAERVKTLLRTMGDADAAWEDRCGAIDALVPRRRPLRFPDCEIDAELERILTLPGGKEGWDFTTIHAATALLLRRGAKSFDLVLDRLQSANPFTAQDLLRVLSTMAAEAGEEQRGRLAAWIRPHFKETNLMISELCLDLWTADLRALKSDLEGIATDSPQSEEDARADSMGGNVQRVRGTFHRARQVAQLWNEEDAQTRAKLLVSFALQNGFLFGNEERIGLQGRFERTMTAAGKELTAEQKQAVVSFASTYAPRSNSSEAPALASRVAGLLK